MSLESFLQRGGQGLSALASWALLIAALGLIAACSGDGSTEQAGQEPATIYRIRAEVRALPIPDRASPELVVRHEAVDQWIDPTGTVVGMDAMTMPFPLETEAIAEGFAAGDLVEMTVEVDWNGPRPVLVTGLETLPEGTELEFRQAAPVAEPSPDEGQSDEGQADEGQAKEDSPAQSQGSD